MSYISEKKNKAQQTIPRIKTVTGLATPEDGSQQSHLLKVKIFATSSKEVEFFLQNSSIKKEVSVTSRSAVKIFLREDISASTNILPRIIRESASKILRCQ